MADSDSTEEGRNSFRRGGFLAAAGFLVLVIAFAVAVVVTNDGGGAPPAKQTTSPPASASSAPPAATGCHPTDTDQQIPQTAPAGIEWSVIKSEAVPTSRTAGPLAVDGDVAGCFAHTPTGALIAALQIEARHLLCDDWKRVTEQQVMPGPGRDAFEKRRATITGDTTDPGTYGQVAAYQFVTYTKDTAVIQFVSRFTDGTMQVSVLTVVWSNGDWRLQLQPDGADSPSSQAVQSLDGFVPWGGV
jgi:hypothetical protein